jgi:hypothetical protein
MGGVKEKGVADRIRLDQGGNEFQILKLESGSLDGHPFVH